MSQPAPSIALALSASFLGFPTHFGFLREMVRNGHSPAAIAGSSAGAIVAGLYAAGVKTETMEELFTRKDLRKHFHERFTLLRTIRTFLGRPSCPAIFRGHKLHDLLKEYVGDIQIEDCKTARLHLAVTNLHTSRVALRTTGPLVDTILASCALPGIIAPRQINDALLWDGGLGSSVPIEPWIDDPSITHIVAHSIIHEAQLAARATTHRINFYGAMAASHQLLADELLHWKLQLAKRAGKQTTAIETVTPRPRLGLPFTLPPPKPWPDYSRDLMNIGGESAKKAAAQLA